jgi:cephalosporin-C deacetylase-like acetyl esterase
MQLKHKRQSREIFVENRGTKKQAPEERNIIKTLSYFDFEEISV